VIESSDASEPLSAPRLRYPMQFDQLRLFVDLVREQSFTRVALLHSITQPAVSLRIQKLEEDLGTQLLERTTRRVLVTEEGRIVYEYAQDMLGRADEVKTVLQSRRDRVVGTIRLATVHTIGLYELPAMLKEFIRRHQEVQVRIDYRSSEQVMHAVLEGSADLGLVAYLEPHDGLTAIPFYEDELGVICSREHPLAGRQSVSLAELAGQPFVGFEADMPTRKAVDALIRGAGVSVDVRMQCDNIDILKRMVEVGLGISVVPLLSVREELRQGTLRALSFAEGPVRRPLAIIHRRAKMLSRAHEAFISLLVQEGAALLSAVGCEHGV
jgi:LysR family transcriptional regulator, transcriptional activator of the cysJI operon